MAKLNVNAATREELVDKAGLRPDVADAILAFRGKHGGRITDVEALDELRGVGPATLDQLRAALDFRAAAEGAGGGNGGADREGAKAAARETTQKTAEAPARGGVKVAREAAADAGVQAAASTVARDGLRLAREAAGAVGEAQRETARRSAEGTAELGRLFAELVNEQTRHNLEVAAAFGRAVDWGEVIQAQGEFVRASFERMNRLNGRYLEIVRTAMRVPAPAAGDRGREAA